MSLDPAITRPGRFDRHINVDLPDITGREQILQVHADKVKLAANADLETIARGALLAFLALTLKA